ncbi:MAG TPA: deiodinase-like protein [Tepidisphaeraceae bacterium]|nr:deiodinase-like protein [Tepidisphaeraceae bacterium]
MKPRFSFPIYLLALSLFFPLNAFAAPATRPAGGNGGYRQNPVAIVKRVKNALSQLDLSDDQKSQAAALMDKLTQEATDMQGQLAGMRPAQRLKMSIGLMQEMFNGLRQILTPQQMQQLIQKVRPGGGQGSPHPLITLVRLQQALQQMQLTQDQQDQISAMIDDIRKQAPALRQAMENGKDVSGKLQAMNAEIHQKLGEILTPDQRQQLHSLMPMIGYLPGGTANQSTTAHPAPPPQPSQPDMMAAPPPVVDPSTAERIAAQRQAIAAAPESPQGLAPTGSQIGQIAPDFSLTSLDDQVMNLSNMKGRVVVLEFGSYSSPSFRDRVAAMDRLRAQFSGVAMFLIVYTREAHPEGDWQVQRNVDAGVLVNQPTILSQRRALARRAVESLNIHTPVVVDTMTDDVTRAYGGAPNAAVVIDRTGRIAGRQNWTDPSGLPELIRAALAAPATQPSR